jgi:hypothetical protein
MRTQPTDGMDKRIHPAVIDSGVFFSHVVMLFLQIRLRNMLGDA